MAVDGDGDGYDLPTDCDDTNSAIYPGAIETPGDGIDQNCDNKELCFIDADHDHYGASGFVLSDAGDLTCSQAGVAPNNADCDDSNPAIHPDATEVLADGIDENCDGHEVCYADDDHDGFGSAVVRDSLDTDCVPNSPAEGISANFLDCDDANAARNPAASEVCDADGVDEDCDGLVNDADPDATGKTTVYQDVDGDGHGDTNSIPVQVCGSLPTGYALNNDDCQDTDPAVHPGGTEIPGDGIDENCDERELCFMDSDHDQYGAPATVLSDVADLLCAHVGVALNNADCDDNNFAIHPNAEDVPGNNIDENCDGHDAVPPETNIISGPPPRTNGTTASFEFSSELGTTFECRTDQGPFGACSGPFVQIGLEAHGNHTTGPLGEGFHTFEVRATNSAGDADPTPASWTWYVDLTPPVATFAMTPPNLSNDPNPQFIFVAEPGATFECYVDAGPFAPCPSVHLVGPLSDGIHTMYVRANDLVGNAQVTPTTYVWTVDLIPPDTSVLRLGATPSDPVVNFALSSDEPGTFECNLDGTGFVPCAPSYTTPPLANGEHTLVVRAIDTAGNHDPSPASQTWLVDGGVDADADGYSPPGDCNDNDPGVHPGAIDVPADGIDQDCDGSDATSVCSNGPSVCKNAGVTTLTIRNDADDDNDRFDFKWTRGDPTASADLGDPTIDAAYTVCVWDSVGGTPTLVMSMDAPAAGNCAGHPCWRPISGGAGFAYKDSGLLPDGIKTLKVMSGELGRSRLTVKGGGLRLPDPPMPFAQDPTIIVQVVNGTGKCWGASFVVAPQENSEARLLVKERP
jgi:hypothetical protein